MLLKKIYNEDTKTQKCWYDSTMFCYTEAKEYDDKNCVDLFVTFKNGTVYKYKEVALGDYVLLLSGYEQSSHGKTLNKIIKPKYQVEKIGNADVNLLMEELEKINKEEQQKEDNKNNTVFISGHRNITEEEFETHYAPAIEMEIENNPYTLFVIGDYYGCDIMAQNYLIDVLNYDPQKITVYHMKESPRNINPKITNTVGGFQTDEERDSAMTNNSYKDIAFVRNHTELSGTAQNILRRFLF